MKADAIIQWFMPKEERFHELLARDTDNLLKAARLFAEIARSASLEERRVKVVQLKAIEHEGDQITRQIQYCLEKDWAVNIEFTDDPHPRNIYWDMWGLPMFDLRDAAGIMKELDDCRRVYGDRYIRVSAFDSTHGWETVRLSFIVNRPKEEPGFQLARQESRGRTIHYSIRAYATDRLSGQRYG